jgi:twitching motility two-component system response regulator PilG
MQGQLHEIDVYSLLQLIELGQRTGKLWIEGDSTWLLSFVQGRIVHAAPVDARPVGAHLATAFSSNSRLQDCLHRLYPNLEETSSSETALSRHLPEYDLLWSLVERKCLTLKQGTGLLRRLIDETLFDVLSLHTGTFRFDMSVTPPAQMATLAIAPHLAVVKQQLQAWKQLYPLVEHPEQYPIIIKPEPLSRQLSGSAFKNLARWADGTVSLRQLARRLNRPMTAVAQAIYPFLEAHLIQLQPSPRSGEGPAAVPPIVPNERLPLHRGHYKIACIDRNATDLEILQQTLKPLGHQIIPFPDPLTALAEILHHPPDLIFCDIDMPLLSGDEFCAMLRQIHRLQRCPIVVLSHKDRFIDRIRVHLSGASDYLTKPFSTEELRILLEKYIDPGYRL